jgi:AcrR family transcriptional regulator
MGRKSKNKVRINNHGLRLAWVQKLMPLVSVNGFSGLTMDDFAIHIGVSKATIYKYFESKEELVLFMVNQKLLEISAYRKMFDDRDMSYQDRFFSGLEIASRSLTDISNHLLSDLKTDYPHIWQKIEDFKSEALESLMCFYQEGLTLNVFKEDINPVILLISDQLMLSSINDPALLRKYGISLKVFFTEYFLMKCVSIFKESQPDEYRLRLGMIAKTLRD